MFVSKWRRGYQAATGALLTVTSSLHCARGMKAHLLGNNPILLTIFPNFPHNFFQSSSLLEIYKLLLTLALLVSYRANMVSYHGMRTRQKYIFSSQNRPSPQKRRFGEQFLRRHLFNLQHLDCSRFAKGEARA